MEIDNSSSTTIMLDHVLPHETIGDLIKRAGLQGKMFKIYITIEEHYHSEKPAQSSHPLADYFENNHPFNGLSEQINRVTNDIRENMSEKLFDKFAK